MIETLKQWQEKIDARVMRERALIFLSFLALIFMVWNFLIQAHFDAAAADMNEQLASLAKERTTLNTQIATATQVLLNDPNKEKKEQIAQLQTDLSNVQNQLQSVSQSLIKAEELPRALEEVLQKTSQLNLLEVNTLPARELQLVEESASVDDNKSGKDKRNAGDADANSAGVYEHVVEIRVAGNFMQVVKFLLALEQLPWRFYWQSLDYKVVQYPNAEVKLRVYTLSAEEGLLGV